MNLFDITFFGINLNATFYGLMYALGFIFGNIILYKRNVIPRNILDDLIIYAFFGVLLGARLGYVIFYKLTRYLDNPLDIFKIWEGGMSFHGGLIGVVIAMLVFSKRFKFNFYTLSDQVCMVIPIGLGFGRLGNYFNNELYGYTSYDGPFAMIVNGTAHFPSPLLEFLLEGVILFIVLNLYYKYKKNYKNGQTASLFLILYAIFRLIIEIFFRLPDTNIGYIFGYLTMGSLLCIPMLLVGIFYYFFLKKNA